LSNRKTAQLVFYFSHGHPFISPGGGEWAAYYMAAAMRKYSTYQVEFIARYSLDDHPDLDPDLDPEAQFWGSRYNDYDPFNHQSLVQPHGSRLRRAIRHYTGRKRPRLYPHFHELMRKPGPDVVHFHHYFYFGMDAIQWVQQLSPKTKIVMTLHDYQAICANLGLMLTRPDNQRCEAASPQACSACFPQESPAVFAQRQSLFLRQLAAVDAFLAPSHFLREKYIDWGLPAEKVHFMDYGRPIWPSEKTAELSSNRPLTVGVFGQMLPHKGVDTYLEAVLAYQLRSQTETLPEVRFELSGSTHYTDARLGQQLTEFIARAPDNFRFLGEYSGAGMRERFAQVDVVVVPSRWWENSPLVIQEAFMAGKPVICADIGAMKEKVREGQDGLHFRVNDASHLLEQILRLAKDPDLYSQLASGLPAVLTDQQMAERVSQLYQTLQG
jgi:glycosyltransferase involved in cell wall biosynthesis